MHTGEQAGTPIRLSYMGYGLLEAWAIAMLFGRVEMGTEGIAVLGNLSGVGIVLGTLAVVLLCRRTDRIARRVPVTVAAAAISTAGTALVLFGDHRAAAIGFMASGIANAWLWVCWGDVFTSFDTEQAEHVVIGSAVLQAVCAAAFVLLPDIARTVLSLAFIPASTVMYVWALRHLGRGPSREGQDWGFHPPIAFDLGFALRFAFGFGVPIFVAYLLLDRAVPLPDPQAGGDMGYITGLLLFIVVLVGFVRFTPSIAVAPVCRTESSLLVAAIVLFGLGAHGSVTGSIMFAVTMLCQYLLIMYAARLYGQGFGNVPKTFGIAQLVNHTAGQLGTLASLASYPIGSPTDGDKTVLVVLIVAMAMLFALVVLVRDDGERERQEAAVAPLEATASEDAAASAAPSVDPIAARIGRIARDRGLSARETEVLALLAKGRSAPYIRDELIISLNTVNSHIKHIYTKLDVHTRQDVIDLVNRAD